MLKHSKKPPIALVNTWLELLQSPATKQHATRMLLGTFDNVKAAERYVSSKITTAPKQDKKVS